MPGEWAKRYWDLDLHQTGLLAQKALAYDPYRQQFEKRLAKYFAFQFRWKAKERADTVRFQVATLLENGGVEADPARPQRTRDRFEKALDQLRADQVINAWSYVVNLDKPPARNWLEGWKKETVAIEPPEPIRGHYARLRTPPRQLRATARRGSGDEAGA